MCREHVKEDGRKRKLWYRMALETKLVLSDDLIISFDTEFGEDARRQKKMNAEQIKQDCENKAFKQFAERIRKDFPRLPILLLCDSLYAGEPMFNICKKSHWNYIIRYKTGSIPSIMKSTKRFRKRNREKRRKQSL